MINILFHNLDYCNRTKEIELEDAHFEFNNVLLMWLLTVWNINNTMILFENLYLVRKYYVMWLKRLGTDLPYGLATQVHYLL